MKRSVFYSWQSDLPNNINRGFIENALKRAITAIGRDETAALEPVVDRDTAGVAGSPDIAISIFAKIASADVFVADVASSIRERAGGLLQIQMSWLSLDTRLPSWGGKTSSW